MTQVAPRDQTQGTSPAHGGGDQDGADVEDDINDGVRQVRLDKGVLFVGAKGPALAWSGAIPIRADVRAGEDSEGGARFCRATRHGRPIVMVSHGHDDAPPQNTHADEQRIGLAHGGRVEDAKVLAEERDFDHGDGGTVLAPCAVEALDDISLARSLACWSPVSGLRFAFIFSSGHVYQEVVVPFGRSEVPEVSAYGSRGYEMTRPDGPLFEGEGDGAYKYR